MSDEQQTTAVQVKQMGDRPGSLITVREIYDDLDRAYRFSKALAIGSGGSERDAANAFAKVVTGAELGIPAGASVRGIHFIQGRISMSADLMVALAREDGWSFAIEHSDPPGQWCKVTASKEDEPDYSFTWSMEMAQNAGLVKGDNWKKYPWDMLYARAASHVARKVAPGRLLGMYAPEELASGDREAFDPAQARSAYQEAETDPLLEGATSNDNGQHTEPETQDESNG